MKKITIISLIFLTLVLTGCNLPGYQEATDESGDSMATEIAKILTGTPVEISDTATQAEMTEPTSTATTEVTEPTQEDTATEEVVETETPAPTETPAASPTPTLSDTDPALTLGDPDWVDDMDDGDNWYTGDDPYTSVAFDDSYMKLTAETDEFGWRLPWPYLEEFYLEATLTSANCEDDDYFGILFSVPNVQNNNSGYLFAIRCDGQYAVLEWNRPTMQYLIDWTESDAINTDESENNTLGIMAVEEKITLYINGQKVEDISAANQLEGGFGIFIHGDPAAASAVWVDQIRYWEID